MSNPLRRAGQPRTHGADGTRARQAAAPSDGSVVRISDMDVEFVAHGTVDEVHTAVRGFSLDIRSGELIVIVGRSGCGKTTILNVLAGLARSSAGEVLVHGLAPDRALEHMAYMFARDALLPWRTARGNIEFALELRRPGMTRSQRRARASDYLDALGIGSAAKLYPWQLSQGMRQRVALARTWAIDPDLLLMDEPFAALDAQTRAETQELFLDVWSREGDTARKTVIFVTHDLTEAVLLADRIVVMNAGAKVDEIAVDLPRPRDPEQVLEDQRFRDIHRRLSRVLQEGGPALGDRARPGRVPTV